MCFVLLAAMLVAEFLIPGSNANVLLVFTVVHKRRSEEPLQKDVFLGQAVLTLQSIVALSINDKTCTLDLRDIEVSSPPIRCMAPRLAGLDVRCGCWLALLHPLCPAVRADGDALLRGQDGCAGQLPAHGQAAGA